MNRHERRKEAALNPPLRDAQVCVGIPSGPQWYAEFAMDTIAMMLDAMHNSTPGWGIVNAQIRNIKGSIIWKQRTELVQKAIDTGCTHLLFIDTDQTFPASTLRRLLAHKKPVVACNVAVKQYPSLPTARKFIEGDQWPIFTRQDSTGLEEVDRIGTGIMLIDLSIMASISKPWFTVSWGDEVAVQYGEDWWFCQQVQEAGHKIYIDHDLSWDVGHIGLMEYKHHHVPPEMEQQVIDIMSAGSTEERLRPLDTATRRLEDQALKSSV